MDKKILKIIVGAAGIRPLLLKLIQVDRLPALRYMAFMRIVLLSDSNRLNYFKDGVFDENLYGDDLIDVYPHVRQKIGVKPENHKIFWEIVSQIYHKLIIYIKNNKSFSVDQKIEILSSYLEGNKTKGFLESNFYQQSEEISKYITDSINQLKDLQIASIDANKGNDQDIPESEESDDQNLEKDPYSIDIISDIREELFATLKIYFEVPHRPILKNLINGYKYDGKILFLSNANKLIDVFVRLEDVDNCHASKTNVIDWIAENFQYRNAHKQIKDMSPGYIKSYFSKNKEIYVTQRIKLDFIKK